jgi:uracil-DNA glycosylase
MNCIQQDLNKTSIYDLTLKFTPKQWKDFFIDNIELIKDISDILENHRMDLCPEIEYIWNVFHRTPKNVRVVILGQDPYHGYGQADGCAFSVQKSEKIPPSLKRVFGELEDNYDNFKPTHGNLLNWSAQGVMLLNTAFSVERGNPASHLGVWKGFTIRLLEYISNNNTNVVFLLWGRKSQLFEKYIKNKDKNKILIHSHPSPLARQPFIGCGHFVQANEYLMEQNRGQIDWKL